MKLKNEFLYPGEQRMKTMTCRQLGGACSKEFHAQTFQKIAELSREHGMEMYKAGDEAHLKAMEEMSELMKHPEKMKEWMDLKKKEFDEIQDD